MKSRLLLTGILLGIASASQAAVTLQMSSTTNYATNFLSGVGSNAATMAWGIVVDASGNGFAGTAANPYASFGNISADSNGAVLSTLSGGVSDDVLYVSSNLMNLTSSATDGSTIGMNRITNLSSIVYSNGVGTGDRYQVIWFDTIAFGTASQGTKYGMFELPATVLAAPWSSAANLLPADPGTYAAAPAFAGADATKSMSFTVGVAVPEPSAALLGAIGALGLLRRRRN